MPQLFVEATPTHQKFSHKGCCAIVPITVHGYESFDNENKVLMSVYQEEIAEDKLRCCRRSLHASPVDATTKIDCAVAPTI